MVEGQWYQAKEIAIILGVKDTRTKELLNALVDLQELIDDGKTKGKRYKKNSTD